MASSKMTSSNITVEQNEQLKLISQLTGESVTSIIGGLIDSYVTAFNAKNSANIKKLLELDAQREKLVSELKGNSAAPAK